MFFTCDNLILEYRFYFIQIKNYHKDYIFNSKELLVL